MELTWWTLLVIVLVLAIDASRDGRLTPGRPSVRRRGALANALHFGSDLFGSTAVLVGLLLARAGYNAADAVAALFVACLVLIAASV